MKNRHFIYIIVTVLVLGILLIWYAGRPKPLKSVKLMPTQPADTDAAALVPRDVTLYFAADNGEYLVSETRQIGCRGEEGCVGEVVRALIAGPQQDAVAVLPARTRLLNVTLEEGTAILDFSPELASGHPGGSQSELLTVYALANSVAVNFPHIRQVAIRINGQLVDTLKGHVDLRRALIADFTFARQSITERLAAPPEEGRPGKVE